jgi:hypothetical protein
MFAKPMLQGMGVWGKEIYLGTLGLLWPFGYMAAYDRYKYTNILYNTN